MRRFAVVLGSLVLVSAASAASAVDVVVLPKPGFPPPARDVAPTGPRLELVSSALRDPATRPRPRPARPAWAPRVFQGAEHQDTIRQGRRLFLLYGADGASARYLVGADRRLRKLEYAFDFDAFMQPPNRGWLEPVTWARQAGGVLYVSNSHLTYASATNGRSAYVTALDLRSGRTLWRSRALVANARTFVVTRDYLVTGYGFTAEPDFLYLLDRRTGRVLDRVDVPSAPEHVQLRGDRLHVRAYDRDLVVRIVS